MLHAAASEPYSEKNNFDVLVLASKNAPPPTKPPFPTHLKPISTFGPNPSPQRNRLSFLHQCQCHLSAEDPADLIFVGKSSMRIVVQLPSNLVLIYVDHTMVFSLHHYVQTTNR